MRGSVMGLFALVLLVHGVGAQPSPRVEAQTLADAAQTHFNEGLRLHRAGEPSEEAFRGAADAWEEVRKLGGASAALLHNLGNAHFLGGRPAHALLAYHHGLRLDPNDDAMRANLAYARAQVRYTFDERGQPAAEHWPPWLHRPSVKMVWTMSLLPWAGAFFFLARWWMARNVWRLVWAGVCLVLTGTLVLAAWGWEASAEYDRQHPLVIVAEDRTPFLRGNGPSYPPHPDLPYLSRGMEARLLQRRGDYLWIQFATGEVGWVLRDAALVDDL